MESCSNSGSDLNESVSFDGVFSGVNLGVAVEFDSVGIEGESDT
jgi:hypothetical protein